ncbi:MAG: signal peptide peptidase SppA [Kiritimatiellae bacterium]|jgi:signal peptide peptidase SppA|nr:signal peptide peptidase SppA [Kiritimatiellia bacterium]
MEESNLKSDRIIIQQSGSGGKGCLWTVIAVQFAVMFVLVLFAVGAIAAAGFSKAVQSAAFDELEDDSVYGRDEYPALTEVWSSGSGSSMTKVVRVPINGFITLSSSDSIFGKTVSPTSAALSAIKRATLDYDVKAIILDVNSGGGGITASDIVYHALMKFKENDPDRKVVAIFGDVAASGAYYIATAADYIVARPTSVTGSLSVIMQSINMYELAQKVGIQDVTITSGDNKDMMNPLKQVNPEQQALLQVVIEQMHTRFVEVIMTGRGLTLEEVTAIADGRIFTAAQAKDLELIDQIGYYEDAQDVCAELLGVEDIKVYRYEEAFNWRTMFGVSNGLDLSNLLGVRNSASPFLYNWEPGK